MRIAIVGNAPFGSDLSREIDRADIVVRFNNAFGYGGPRGSRIDDLFLVNCGGQPLEWLESQEFWQRDYVGRARRIVLPVADDPQSSPRRNPRVRNAGKVDGINFAPDLRMVLQKMGKTVSVVPVEIFQRACRIVGTDRFTGRPVVPSTGFLAILSYVDHLPPNGVIDLYGFGFAGWDGHGWAGERGWVERRHAEGVLIWHRPPDCR